MTFCNTLVVVRITALSSWSKKLIRIVVRKDAVPCAGVFISWRTKSKHICFIWLLICISSTNLCLYGHLVMYLLIMGWFQGCFDGVIVENYSLYCTKKRSFPLAILLVNMNKFTETCALHSHSHFYLKLVLYCLHVDDGLYHGALVCFCQNVGEKNPNRLWRKKVDP